MGDHKTQTPEWVSLLGKFLMAAAYIAIGIMAKLAIDSRNQKLTRTQIIIKICSPTIRKLTHQPLLR